MSVNEPLKTKNTLGLRVIAIMKLVSAALLLTLTFGIFHMLGSDVGRQLEHYIRRLHLDVDRKFITNLIAKASGVSASQLRSAGTVTLVYAVLYVIEGVGLLMEKHWAEYLTVIVTGALIPLEVYEVVRRTTATRISILLINLAIVGYLIYRLRADNRRQHALTKNAEG